MCLNGWRLAHLTLQIVSAFNRAEQSNPSFSPNDPAKPPTLNPCLMYFKGKDISTLLAFSAFQHLILYFQASKVAIFTYFGIFKLSLRVPLHTPTPSHLLLLFSDAVSHLWTTRNWSQHIRPTTSHMSYRVWAGQYHRGSLGAGLHCKVIFRA